MDEMWDMYSRSAHVRECVGTRGSTCKEVCVCVCVLHVHGSVRGGYACEHLHKHMGMSVCAST